MADPPQRLLDLALLDLELTLVGELLPRRTGMVGECRNAIRSRLEQLGRASLSVGALAMVNPGAHEIPRECAVDEDDVATQPRDAGATERERVDAQLELIADGRSRDRLAAHASSHSSRAFCAWRRFSA